MPQPLKSGIDGHQRRNNLHPVMAGTPAGVNTAGYLVQVIAHAGKLAQQRRRDWAPFGKRTILYVKMIFCTVMARSKTEPNGLFLTEDNFFEILQVLL